MANWIRTGDPHGFNKGRSSKFREGSRVWQSPEEGQRTYWPKHCGNNNKDEDNSPKTLNDKNQQASSQKFRQLISNLSFDFYISKLWKWRKLLLLCFDLRPGPKKNAIPRWCTRRKWHIPMASNRKRSRGRIKAYNMGQGEGPTVPIQTDAPEEWPLNCMTVISDSYFRLMTIKH